MSYSTYASEGRLVRGVIYDDVDMEAIKKDMFEKMHFDGVNQINNYFAKEMYNETRGNVSIEDAKLYFTNMSAISALTGYSEESDKTYNFIIPKESVCSRLQEELETIDLGKNLIREYADDFFVNYCGATKITPNDFNERSKEEKLLQHVDRQIADTNKKEAKCFVDGKRVSVEEFCDMIENDPELADMMGTIMNTLQTGKVVCF